MLTDAWTPLRHHPDQSDAWRTKALYVAMACGRGSGKTEIARRYIVRWLPVKKPWHDPMYFYALPTVSQAKRVAWKKIKDLVPRHWIRKVNESEMLIETKYGSSLYVVGMDKPQRIEGTQWDGGVIDESCDQRPHSFERSILPALTHRNGWCWRIGVPKRTGIGAAEFRNFWEKCNAAKDGKSKAYCWPSSDILTPQQLAWHAENMDERDYDEQYNAKWGDLSGAIFYAFDPKQDVDAERAVYDPNAPIVVGSDFNVDPMAWIIAQRYPKTLIVLDELFIRNTNTPATLDRLWQRWQHHKGMFEFYGDATGQARKTSANKSDYLHIVNDSRFVKKRVYYPRTNPRRADRFASCNAMFRSADGQRHVVIHPRCVHLIADLTTRAYIEGTNEPDDVGDIGHITDAFGYPVHRLWPVSLDAPSEPPQVGVYDDHS